MLAGLATVIAQLPDPPDQGVGTDPDPYIALFAAGFVLAVFGHIFKFKPMVAAGVAMVFLATVVLPVYFQLTH